MAVPKYHQFYGAFLRALADGKGHSMKEIRTAIAAELNISPEYQSVLLATGQPVFQNRVGWARTYLKKAGLIDSSRRGVQVLTPEGAKVLAHPPASFDNQFLLQYPSFQAFYHHTAPAAETEGAAAADDETPLDLLESAIGDLNQRLAEDLLREILEQDSDFFERLVVRLLRKMGYGGSEADSGIVTQKTRDGGIDGIIREDKLGFSHIYIQAKRWSGTVQRPEIQKFSGALHDEGGGRGLFITTGTFSQGAQESARRQHIVLVDGPRLARLMIEYDLGVSTVATYQVKKLDTDFFQDELE